MDMNKKNSFSEGFNHELEKSALDIRVSPKYLVTASVLGALLIPPIAEGLRYLIPSMMLKNIGRQNININTGSQENSPRGRVIPRGSIYG